MKKRKQLAHMWIFIHKIHRNVKKRMGAKANPVIKRSKECWERELRKDKRFIDEKTSQENDTEGIQIFF